MAIKNVKQVASKAQGHTVKFYGQGVYGVVSGSSGTAYRVQELQNGGATCSCDWGKWRKIEDPRSGCSHVQAVVQFKAAEAGRKVSAFGSLVDAKRQRKSVIEVGDGVFVSSRKS